MTYYNITCYHPSGEPVEMGYNHVTAEKGPSKELWLVSCTWRGGHDKRPFRLENIYRSYGEAMDAWEKLTPEGTAISGKDGILTPREGFLRLPIVRFVPETSHD